MKKKYTNIIIFSLLMIASIGIGYIWGRKNSLERSPEDERASSESNNEPFAEQLTLEETDTMKHSKHEFWWLNSGGIMLIDKGIAKTNLGKLSSDNKWRELYADSNPEDTDEGYHPQNIFRLVTKGEWKNYSQQVYFQILEVNESASENRNESNGVLLFNRYQDGNTLYYTGVRVDGAAVIKKKFDGEYSTLAYEKVYDQGAEYDRDDAPCLLPEKKWMGIKSVVATTPEGNVSIKLFTDETMQGNWKLVAEAIDGNEEDVAAIHEAGHAGIRIDFMDALFQQYRIEELSNAK